MRRHRVCERVRWSDVDTSGIIRWDAYTRFVELAETELFRAAGHPYGTLWKKLDLWLPRVQFHVDMRSPARLDELLETEIQVARIGRGSIRLEFAVRNASGGRIAEGHLVMAAIRRSSGRTIAVPVALAKALSAPRAARRSARSRRRRSRSPAR